MFGKQHSEETKALMSIANQGESNPMFGKVPVTAKGVVVYSTCEGVLVNYFKSRVAAAKWLNVSESYVRKLIKSGKVFNGTYIIRNE